MGSVCGAGRPLAASCWLRGAGSWVREGASDGMKGANGKGEKGVGEAG